MSIVVLQLLVAGNIFQYMSHSVQAMKEYANNSCWLALCWFFLPLCPYLFLPEQTGDKAGMRNF